MALEAAQTLLALMHAQGEVARLSEREQLFSTLLVSVNAVLWAFNWETRQVLYVSPAYERIFGRSADLLLSDYNQWRDSIYPDDLEYAERSLADVLEKGAIEDREYRIIAADGQVRWLSDKCFMNRQAEPGQPVIIVGIAEDITDKKQMETELQRLATTDALTQSKHRRHFFEGAHQEFEIARQQGTPLSFLMLDIDDFKSSTTLMVTRKAITCCSVSRRAVEQRCAVAICSGALAVRSSRRCSRAARRTWPCKWLNDCRGRSSV